MELHIMGAVFIMSILVVLGVVAAGDPCSVDMGPACTYWKRMLHGVAMPALLHEAVSPVEGSALADLFAMHIQHGTFYPSTSASFCKIAGLNCQNEGIHLHHHHDNAAYRYKEEDKAVENQLDKEAYRYDKAAYRYKEEDKAVENQLDKEAYRYDKAAYRYKEEDKAVENQLDKEAYRYDEAAYRYQEDKAVENQLDKEAYRYDEAAYRYKEDKAVENQLDKEAYSYDEAAYRYKEEDKAVENQLDKEAYRYDKAAYRYKEEDKAVENQLDKEAYRYDKAAYWYKEEDKAVENQLDKEAYRYDKAAYWYKEEDKAVENQLDKEAYRYDKAAYWYKEEDKAVENQLDKEAYRYDKAAYRYKEEDKAIKNHRTEADAPSKGYFSETDLVEGATLRLKEQPPIQPRPFLPRVVADELPPLTIASLSKLQRIFNIQEGTNMYAALDFATTVCEPSSALPGEQRICPASLESFVDFLSSHVGPDVKVLTSSPRPRVVMGPMKVTNFTQHYAQDGLNVVVCHILVFPSQLYMCHSVPDTKVVEASLTDADGSVTRAVGVCHLDTKMWSPGHQSFRILGVHPGTTVCHWVAQESLVWVSTKSKDSPVIHEAVAHGEHMAMDMAAGHDMSM